MIREETMANKCSVCGAPLSENTCGYCGNVERTGNHNANVNNVPPQQPQVVINNQTIQQQVVYGVSKKSKTVALLLCIFLGYIGIHRFYAGKIGTGILYLLTGGLFGIGWIVDIILIATGAFKDNFGLPINH